MPFAFVFVDPISAVMILVITGVGTLIHLFSVGYMAHDAHPSQVLRLFESVSLEHVDSGAWK